jgi:excisionase family DNA binding protein
MTERLAYGLAEAAQAVGLSVRSLHYLIKTGRLGFAKVGRRVLIPHAELEKLLRRASTKATEILDADQPIRPKKQKGPGARATPGHSCNSITGSHPGRSLNDNHQYTIPEDPTA